MCTGVSKYKLRLPNGWVVGAAETPKLCVVPKGCVADVGVLPKGFMMDAGVEPNGCVVPNG